MRFYKISLLCLVVGAAGCSVTPYRNDFACALQDDYGKCIDVQGAYNEAVTGKDSGAPRLSRKGDQVQPMATPSGVVMSPTSGRGSSQTNGDTTMAVTPHMDEYGAYRSAVYQQMRTMLTTPTTPMVKPATTVRTLIISYANRQDRSRLYMPRYVFSISEGPQFVMGEYLNRRPELVPDSVVKVSQESMTKDTH
ncbi:MAG: TraV family lipoprotein [Gammaproteobacteria bacterium]|nr:TraV family lipoprotein [Gammaproteobacteria bacterium]